ncbi:MAG: hypothetical protein NC240_04475 [Clostridium sp.]|nr:hypothetical protein [Clostridium sp.]
MEKYNAEQDIQFIRTVLNKTQSDISEIGMCFILIGIANLIGEVVKYLGYIFIDAQKEISGFQWKMLRAVDGIVFIVICVIFLVYYRKLFHVGNDISKSILKIWGVLLIGGKAFTKVFAQLAMQNQTRATGEFAATLEKAFSFLCVIIALAVLGIVIHDKLICGGAILGIIMYCLLLCGNHVFTIAQIHGNSVNLYSWDIFSIIILSLGMVLLGLYVKIIGRKKRGNS